MAKPSPPASAVGVFHRITTLFTLAVLGGAGFLGYQVLRNGVAADVYHDRLVELNDDYIELADQYNQAITRSAVTELLVEDGAVCVKIRTADGEEDTHMVEADPSHPIYVDYVVHDSKLLIRRVFDSKSAPDDAGVIDSKLLQIDWTDPAVKHGQAIYRQLSDGRWIVTVSGDGSLALDKVDSDTEVNLMAAPEVGDFDPVEATQAEIKEIGPADVLGRVFGSASSSSP